MYPSQRELMVSTVEITMPLLDVSDSSSSLFAWSALVPNCFRQTNAPTGITKGAISQPILKVDCAAVFNTLDPTLNALDPAFIMSFHQCTPVVPAEIADANGLCRVACVIGSSECVIIRAGATPPPLALAHLTRPNPDANKPFPTVNSTSTINSACGAIPFSVQLAMRQQLFSFLK